MLASASCLLLHTVIDSAETFLPQFCFVHIIVEVVRLKSIVFFIVLCSYGLRYGLCPVRSMTYTLCFSKVVTSDFQKKKVSTEGSKNIIFSALAMHHLIFNFKAKHY